MVVLDGCGVRRGRLGIGLGMCLARRGESRSCCVAGAEREERGADYERVMRRSWRAAKRGPVVEECLAGHTLDGAVVSSTRA